MARKRPVDHRPAYVRWAGRCGEGDAMSKFAKLQNLFGEFWQLRGHTRKEGYATMTISRLLRVACGFVLGMLCLTYAAMGQTETATISGLITDDTGAVMPGAEVKLQNIER